MKLLTCPSKQHLMCDWGKKRFWGISTRAPLCFTHECSHMPFHLYFGKICTLIYITNYLKKKNHYSFINNYLLAYSNVKKPRVALIFKIFLYAGIIRNICSDWLITVHDCVFYLDTLLPHWQCIWRHDHAEKESCRQSGAFQMKLHGG